MNYKVIPTDKFKKEAKKLIKKYASLKNELKALSIILEETPFVGSALGNNSYKIRISIKSKVAGKSGGARVVTYVVANNGEIYLLTIYDKAKLDTIDSATLRKIIGGIKKKLE
jgi:mRNA-degrading endonuclease RelE of RelBE toxin-antitoxin system